MKLIAEKNVNPKLMKAVLGSKKQLEKYVRGEFKKEILKYIRKENRKWEKEVLYGTGGKPPVGLIRLTKQKSKLPARGKKYE